MIISESLRAYYVIIVSPNESNSCRIGMPRVCKATNFEDHPASIQSVPGEGGIAVRALTGPVLTQE